MDRMINVTIDCICALYTFMILLYLCTTSDRKEKLNRLFVGICICNLGMLLGDIPNWLCEGFAHPWFPAMLRTGLFIQYLSGYAIAWVFSLYMHTYLSDKYKIKGKSMMLIHVITNIAIILTIVNLWNGMFYQITAENIYERSSFFWLSQVLPASVMVIDVGVILFYRQLLKIQEISLFLGYMMLPLAGIMIQIRFYGVVTTYLTSSIALFILFLGVQSTQRLVAEQQKRDLDKAHLLVMLSQIKPHFLYNSLLGIKQLCDMDPKRASDALEHFSYYLRGNLDSLSNTDLILFEKELEHVQNYLYLEKMRFENKITIKWEIGIKDFRLPSLTLQPIVENAICHGLTKKKGGGTITIKSEEDEKSTIIITVTDDGAGFNQSVPPDTTRPHIGLENVQKRLEAQCGGRLEVCSALGIGTEVKIILP